MMRVIEQPDRAAIINLREVKKLSRAEIAAHYGVSVATVRRWIKEMKIPRPKRRYPVRVRSKGEADPYLEGHTSFEQARQILGQRVIERTGYGYYLDGKPAAVDDILKAAGIEAKPVR